eukprot:2593432-Amphidinium_carterae.2
MDGFRMEKALEEGMERGCRFRNKKGDNTQLKCNMLQQHQACTLQGLIEIMPTLVEDCQSQAAGCGAWSMAWTFVPRQQRDEATARHGLTACLQAMQRHSASDLVQEVGSEAVCKLVKYSSHQADYASVCRACLIACKSFPWCKHVVDAAREGVASATKRVQDDAGLFSSLVDMVRGALDQSAQEPGLIQCRWCSEKLNEEDDDYDFAHDERCPCYGCLQEQTVDVSGNAVICLVCADNSTRQGRRFICSKSGVPLCLGCAQKERERFLSMQRCCIGLCLCQVATDLRKDHPKRLELLAEASRL